MRNVVAANKCLAANNILRMRKRNHAFSPSCDRSCVKMADKTIIGLRLYRKTAASANN